MKVAITGANGHLGRRLIRFLGENAEVQALVRSERARRQLDGEGCQVSVVDYHDRAGLATQLAGHDAVINLVGIIRETPDNSYVDAHERTCEALAAAAADARVGRIVMPGIVGSALESTNACLRSRARSEAILLDGPASATILRIPMVLGEGDYASRALFARATRPVSVTFRAASLEQPIYAGDVVAALASLLDDAGSGILSLGGPETLTRAALTRRAAATLGRQTRVVSLPLALGHALTALLGTILQSPPMTRPMLDLLDHDDEVDNAAALSQLGITLTSLDTMLAQIAATLNQPQGTAP